MSVVNAIPLLLGDEGYNISRSVRLRSSASAYFNRTPGTAGNRRTYTYSAWIKRGLFQASFFMLGADDGSLYSNIGFISGDYFGFNHVPNTGGTVYQWRTQAVFRDPSAWYHVVCAIDTTQATAANRIRIYVNGIEQTSLVDVTGYGAIPQNTDTFINSVQSHMMGRFIRGANNQFDGYLTEVNFIDGQALTPSSFGETDTITGVWKPKKYAGTYGTNGFYLNFSDNSAATATTIGKDNSGNGNNWTPNNISVTAGVTYDSMIDVPTLYADRGNYCTLNPLIQRWAVASATFSNANQTITTSGASTSFGFGTIAVSFGKFYWEATVTAVGTATPGVGVTTNEAQSTVQTNTVVYLSNGQKEVGGSASSYGASYTTNDVIGVALDCDSGTVTFYKNNTSQGSISLVTSANLLPHFQVISNSTFNANFGQRPFAYTPPTGFKALNTQNLPEPVIKKGNQFFDATTYTGNGSTQSIVNAGGFQPDLVWGKARSLANSNFLVDSVRGSSLFLSSDQTIAEVSNSSLVSSLNSNGYSVGNTTTANQNAATYVGWQWRANGSAVTNTSGSITSQVSAGTSQGFSVVTYTGTGANATVGHGLGVAPKLIILKDRTRSARQWPVYHASLGAVNVGFLNLTNAWASSPTTWNSTVPTSTVFSLGSDATSNQSGDSFVAYCFSEVAGFSKFGSYTGNGSADGPFVFCGFRPRYILWKRTDTTGDWGVIDTARDTYNTIGYDLTPNASSAEGTGYTVDFLSNGFKIRLTATRINASGGTFIFMAFAESPFRNSLAR